MAKWAPLQELLARVDQQITLTWQELSELVGELPPSTSKYQAFWWKGRSQWAGFTPINVVPGNRVTFVRNDLPAVVSRRKKVSPPCSVQSRSAVPTARSTTDLVFVACAKSKQAFPAPAQDLYISDLFLKSRQYAESTGKPWFILSAEHGLVQPETLLEPYERYLPSESATYQRLWGDKVLRQILELYPDLSGMTIEIHAGALYAAMIAAKLRSAGATVVLPLDGLRLGERLQWYNQVLHQSDDGWPVIADPQQALSPQQFIERHDPAWDKPGLYSWFVDESGAHELSAGIGMLVQPGLVYAGLAGATRTVPLKASRNTLWLRITSMHLKGPWELSTLRHTLGAILNVAWQDAELNESRLTRWMFDYLKVSVYPVADADSLHELESKVLQQLNPPLNLAKVPSTEMRKALSLLRRKLKQKEQTQNLT